MATTSNLDVLGAANILPLDHTYIVPRRGRLSLVSVVNQLRLTQPAEAENPTPDFPYSGYRRSGGGRIANVLAYLGTHRHSVAVCGVVGADLSGDLVLDDLEKHSVRRDHVKRLEGQFTWVSHQVVCHVAFFCSLDATAGRLGSRNPRQVAKSSCQ